MVKKKYIPALKFKILTPFFDNILSVLMKETKIKSQLVTQLNLKDNENILDFGCGTGTLTLMIKRANPSCLVNGIDVDPQVLEIAQNKARLENADINFIEYDAITFPFADESIDKVATSLVLHHLSMGEKYIVFKEMYRVLKKGGELHILDIGIPKSRYAKIVTSIFKHLEPIEDNILGKISKFLIDTGFQNVKEVNYENTFFGTVSFYSLNKPK